MPSTSGTSGQRKAFTNPETRPTGQVITFSPAIVVKTVGGAQVRTMTMTINSTEDDAVNRTVKAYTAEAGVIVLWSGDAYDAIGQWTDADVKARLIVIFGGTSGSSGTSGSH